MELLLLYVWLVGSGLPGAVSFSSSFDAIGQSRFEVEILTKSFTIRSGKARTNTVLNQSFHINTYADDVSHS